MNSANRVHKNRREHLTLKLAEGATQADIAADLGLNSSRYISAIASGRRNMGHQFARKMERRYDLPTYALDQPAPVTSIDHKLAQLPEEVRRDLLTLINTMLLHCQAANKEP